MIDENRLFEVEIFYESSFNLFVTNYLLTTDLTSLSSTPLAVTSTPLSPGCGTFLNTNVIGTLQTNGKIGFVIDTSSLQSPCYIRVYAELSIFPTIFAFTS